MRRMVHAQPPLVAPFVAQAMGQELAAISTHLDLILDDDLMARIKADLTRGLVSPERGREGQEWVPPVPPTWEMGASVHPKEAPAAASRLGRRRGISSSRSGQGR